MLYKLNSTDGQFDSIEAVAFSDFADFGHREKDLEDLIARDVLFEEVGLMPTCGVGDCRGGEGAARSSTTQRPGYALPRSRVRHTTPGARWRTESDAVR